MVRTPAQNGYSLVQEYLAVNIVQQVENRKIKTIMEESSGHHLVFQKRQRLLVVQILIIIKKIFIRSTFCVCYCSRNFTVYLQSFLLHSFLRTHLQLSPVVAQRQSHCLTCSSPRFDFQQGRNFNFFLGLELGGMVENNLNRQFLFQISGFN